jgi:hypothetical protein
MVLLNFRNCVPVAVAVLDVKAVPGTSDVVVFTETNYWHCEDPTVSGKLEYLQTGGYTFHTSPGPCQQVIA